MYYNVFLGGRFLGRVVFHPEQRSVATEAECRLALTLVSEEDAAPQIYQAAAYVAIAPASAAEVLQWEKEQGVVGILSSHVPDGAVAVRAGGRIVGAATVSHRWIAGVLVDPAHRRRGWGKALFLQALKGLREAGHETVRVQPCSIGGWALLSSLSEEDYGRLSIKDD